ncbi:Undecaprenyl-phosphate alpha-N-acetylglucosaminyl 1-phosphate transferase [hydrothermal vent metagenome]|uniref:Undecaprenyl-phosphate alpha-N-acetylglucosaminyl 1-phosphate transferase n=1 Tax=hydrothermal vent metagenome TaxID=652676 RepID=A0A3B1DK50_9ZZZZ
MEALFITTGIALVSSLLLTPVVRRLAYRWNMVDHPDEHRKLHKNSIPLGGGLSVFSGMVIALCSLLIVPNPWQETLRNEGGFLLSLAGATFGLVLVGLIDDRYSLRGRQKGMGQLAVVSLLIASGLLIQNVQFFGWRIELGVMAIPFTLFWLLGAINALNLIDGVDGLATSVGIVIGLALAVMAFMTNHFIEGILALALVGSLTGFLYHNFPPARIFLGDAGSMLIGLILGVLAIRSSLKGPATVALAAPTALLAIPAFDVGMAILRRKLTGRSIYSTDRGHLHHCLQHRGYSSRRTLMTIAVLCILTGLGALASILYHNEYLALGGVAAVVGTMLVTRFFGHSECLLLLRKVRRTLRSFIPSRSQSERTNDPVFSRFGGDHEWEILWGTLTNYAERFDISAIELNVNLPALHEEYHASWERKSLHQPDDIWETQIPLTADNKTVGRLRIRGMIPDHSVCNWMSDLIGGLQPFEIQIGEMIEEVIQKQAISQQTQLLQSTKSLKPAEVTTS